MHTKSALLTVISVLMAGLAWGADPDVIQLQGEKISLEFDRNLRSRVIAKLGERQVVLGGFSESESLETSPQTTGEFRRQGIRQERIRDQIGAGTRYHIAGKNDGLEKRVTVTLYDDFPSLATTQVRYINRSGRELTVNGWRNNNYLLDSGTANRSPLFWSYQSGSYESRPDWVLPLDAGFSQDNFQGMNGNDYGGGTPVLDLWRKDVGIAVGHLEPAPKLVSLPVFVDRSHATLGVSCKIHEVLKPGGTLETLRTFVSVHQGDFFATLVDYRRFMSCQGIRFDTPSPAAYGSIWCAWGFEREFTVDQITKALPKVSELGYTWAVLDDGWQTSEGDWQLNPVKFPRGDADMIGLVERIHSDNLKARLWWAPLSVDPGTELITKHEDYLLLNQDGSRRPISWWDAFYLCPAYPPVIEYTKDMVRRMIQTWGYDGLKIDGQYLNAAPLCYNPAHHHRSPNESVEKMPEFFKAIYATARSIKPDAVLEVCPCGSSYSFFTMPFMSHGVASDPTSSWQIRLKGKTLKALMGREAPYFGDHVELSDGGNDFASSFGVGAVIGTKFTWPEGSRKNPEFDLTPNREQVWKKWQDLYREKMLSNGTYLGELYDIGFDQPETHAITKNGVMYYAFYAREPGKDGKPAKDTEWKGTVTLRGLERKAYRVKDYVDGTDYGRVQGPEARISVDIKKALLVEATPETVSSTSSDQ